MKNFKVLSFVLMSVFCLMSCNAKSKTNKEVSVPGYKSVAMEEGLKLMESSTDFVLLDVRTPEEYAAGHIPGAVQLTNETFTEMDAAKVIKDKSQNVYVYCKSGRRSKESSKKLVDFGYTNVIEIGGIMDYTGEIER